MAPDYRYLIEPWSIRGFDTTQGIVMALIGAAILAGAVVLSIPRLSNSPTATLIVTGAMTGFAVLLATLTSPPGVSLGWPAVWGLALLAGVAVQGLVAGYLPRDWAATYRRLATIGTLVGTIVVAGILFTALFSGNDTPLWVIVLIGFALMGLLVLTRRPRELAVHRLLINGVVIGWIAALSMSGALRTTLQRLQETTGGVGADFREIQITSGVMITWLGGLLAFVGAVALWAQRREQIEAHHRAQSQLKAARESAEELGEELTSASINV
jgi:hypothetical protein